jgi:hypothetical protein
MEGEVRWHHGQTLAAGHVAEFKVWAELVRQSMGGLHVFLPNGWCWSFSPAAPRTDAWTGIAYLYRSWGSRSPM